MIPSNLEALRAAIRDAARQAFEALRKDHPFENFYYYALVTTEDALRPGPSASSTAGLDRIVQTHKTAGYQLEHADLRWSEADSPYNLYADHFFAEVERLFLQDGDHRKWPASLYQDEVRIRWEAMEMAMRDLDRSGFFGTGADRHQVVINVVAPGDEPESMLIERARRLNPPESLQQLIRDLCQP